MGKQVIRGLLIHFVDISHCLSVHTTHCMIMSGFTMSVSHHIATLIIHSHSWPPEITRAPLPCRILQIIYKYIITLLLLLLLLLHHFHIITILFLQHSAISYLSFHTISTFYCMSCLMLSTYNIFIAYNYNLNKKRLSK